ncbi:unnamed protein product [Sympodiomycopsis kandeliae]
MAQLTTSFNLATSSSDQILSLDNIRSVLQRLEDTIVFSLIERSQFSHNELMYQDGVFPELISKENWKKSWVEWFIKESESAHAKCRRWEAPDEYPFTDENLLPKPILPPVKYPSLLYEHDINANGEIFTHYKDVIVPTFTNPHSDDGQYGSAACRDVELLSALSRRIHFGMFVSESKFRSDPKAFLQPIREKNSEQLLALITKPAVEKALLVRLREKANVYGQDLNQPNSAHARKIQPDQVVELYESFVIPLTKKVEVDYLLKRLEHLSPAQLQRIEDGKGYSEDQ